MIARLKTASKSISVSGISPVLVRKSWLLVAEKGDSHGTQPGNDERTLGRLGKSKAGDFAAAKDVAGRGYFASEFPLGTERSRAK